MGFVGLLQFAVKYFVGVLAWPVIALGYPLCASIKAIETDSVSDTKKLNTYWVVFSLILLLEHAFGKLLEWLVIWPYIRLMIVCWLVIPYFDGGFYIYKQLIRPCLSVDHQIVINWFNKWKESYVKDNILKEMERYVKENGPEALEKILASKSGSTKPNLDVQGIESVLSMENKVVEKSGSTKPNLDVKEIESVSSIENKMVEKSGSTKPNLDVQGIESVSSIENKVVEKSGSTKPNLDVKEIESVSSIENKMVEKSASTKPNLDVKEIESVSFMENKVVEKMKFQTLSAGALKDLNSGSPNVTLKDIKPVEVLEKKEVRAAEQVSRVEPNPTQVEKRNFAVPEIKMMIPEVVVAAHRELPKTPAPPDHKVQKWTCEICQVTTTSEITLKEHFNGKKHKTKTHSRSKPKEETAKRATTSSSGTKQKVNVKLEEKVHGHQPKKPNNVEVQGQPESIHASAARKSEPKEEPAKRATTSSSGTKQKVNVKLEEKVHGHQPKKPNNVEVQGQPQSIHASAARKSEPKEEPAKRATTSSSGTKQKVNVKLEEKVHGHQPKKPNNGSNFGVKSSSLWCSVCNVSCTSEIDMVSHLRGRRHSSLWCSVCNVSCTSEIDMVSHLRGRRHLGLI